MSSRRASTRSSPLATTTAPLVASRRISSGPPTTPTTPTLPAHHITYESFADLVHIGSAPPQHALPKFAPSSLSNATSNLWNRSSPHRPGAGGRAHKNQNQPTTTTVTNTTPHRESSSSCSASSPSSNRRTRVASAITLPGSRRPLTAGPPRTAPIGTPPHREEEYYASTGERLAAGDDDDEEEEDDDTSCRRVAQGIMGYKPQSHQPHPMRTHPDKHPLDHTGTGTSSSTPDLTTFDLVKLTLGLAGAQFAWTVEMAFGTPYLSSLGLTKRTTSLVWLAGPLAGLIMQPSIGALSDASKTKYRRRAFIAASTASVVVSTLFVAYANEIGSLLSGWSGLGDWDPKQDHVRASAIAIGVLGFYVLDSSLNGLKASLRALILDQSPRHQQNVANAWHGRMTHFANIFGYGAGYIDLGHWAALSWVGGGQFRKLAVMACVIMTLCVAITCWTQVERISSELQIANRGIRWSSIWINVRKATRELPLSVRRVCYLQVFQWTAWFPFLFYSTSYVAEVLYASLPPDQEEPSTDTATRAGSLALLLYALVSLGSGSLLLWLTTLGRRKIVDRRLSRTSKKVRLMWHLLANMTPRNMWTLGTVLYASAMVATFWVKTVEGAMSIVAFCGVSWAVQCWVPFALVMESIREIEPASAPTASSLPSSEDARTSPSQAPSRTNYGSTHFDRGSKKKPFSPPPPPFAHSSSQLERFFVAVVAACIFSLLEKKRSVNEGNGKLTDLVLRRGLELLVSTFASEGGGGSDSEPTDGLRGANDVVWVLRFGGLAALVGVFFSRYLLETTSEAEYKDQVLAWPFQLVEEEEAGE
ncbi:LOW QUALITY PROTEIN: Sucrose transporter [Microbotryum lychnidis-dioicae p1A1 Lamole]|uniref:Sucrose transporter n=1 Tax=Microbotryum lychnidis-dioicae (strain p1A1 Lamole / MvSl-1064) TaxID=683840 RepID=U5HI66_USTV1|nr:LOW QUALITY PROTEIN: Sucrose transporter [Microbotryum lychnidis-dioicae p1A1 Lamole]|eukprot:KDE02736.1 LOW QUALITY PROTEIN: Sucrose transporter [Microbotryum lychnidis-dioicae p1A1 Lamole]